MRMRFIMPHIQYILMRVLKIKTIFFHNTSQKLKQHVNGKYAI